MKNLNWVAGLIVILLVVTIGFWGLKNHSLGAVTSPPSVMDYLQLTQALGFGPLGGAANVNIMGVKAQIPTGPSLITCSLQNPFNATSTVMNAVLNITTGTSSVATLVFATSTTATATTTKVATYILGAGQNATIGFYGATTTGEAPSIAPNGYLNVGTDISSAVAYPYTYAGNCSAIFMQSS